MQGQASGFTTQGPGAFPRVKRETTVARQREFDGLENELKALETERQSLYDQMNKGSLPYEDLQKITARLTEISTAIDEKELRWLELSEAVS